MLLFLQNLQIHSDISEASTVLIFASIPISGSLILTTPKEETTTSTSIPKRDNFQDILVKSVLGETPTLASDSGSIRKCLKSPSPPISTNLTKMDLWLIRLPLSSKSIRLKFGDFRTIKLRTDNSNSGNMNTGYFEQQESWKEGSLQGKSWSNIS